jgi:hypothetical protein
MSQIMRGRIEKIIMKKGSKRKKKQIIRTKINKNKMKSNYEG